MFDEVGAQVRLADRLGYDAAWFAEHHFHVHRGHLPNPILLALHLAGRTERIRLGSAVITTALHHPLRLAGDLLTADVLTGGRLSIGIGSGSTASEFGAFGVDAAEQTQAARHGRFAEGLEVLEQAWSGGPVSVHGEYVDVELPPLLPRALRPLRELLWIAANSEGQAELAGRRGYGMMLSRERTPAELERLRAAFEAGRTAARASGARTGAGRIAASRAAYVGESDAGGARRRPRRWRSWSPASAGSVRPTPTCRRRRASTRPARGCSSSSGGRRRWRPRCAGWARPSPSRRSTFSPAGRDCRRRWWRRRSAASRRRSCPAPSGELRE